MHIGAGGHTALDSRSITQLIKPPPEILEVVDVLALSSPINCPGVTNHIGDGVFVGSNTSLVAPVSVEDGANIGAGSVITTDVPSQSLAIGRGRQRNIEGWATRKKNG